MVPDDLRARLVARFGEAAGAWADELPARVDAACRRFGVRPDGAVTGGNTAVVVPCDTGVLTLTPEPAIAVEEADALGRWHGCRHVVDLLGRDDDAGALLLERLRPGTPLGPDAPLSRALPALRGLWDADGPVDGLLPLSEGLERLLTRVAEQATEPAVAAVLDPDLVDRAADRARALAAEPGHVGLVHGDLHPGNLLRVDDDRLAVAVDPRASVGDRTFDLIDTVLVDLANVPATIDRLAASLPGLDPERLRAWVDALTPAVAVLARRRDPDADRTRALAARARR